MSGTIFIGQWKNLGGFHSMRNYLGKISLRHSNQTKFCPKYIATAMEKSLRFLVGTFNKRFQFPFSQPNKPLNLHVNSKRFIKRLENISWTHAKYSIELCIKNVNMSNIDSSKFNRTRSIFASYSINMHAGRQLHFSRNDSVFVARFFAASW